MVNFNVINFGISFGYVIYFVSFSIQFTVRLIFFRTSNNEMSTMQKFCKYNQNQNGSKPGFSLKF